MNKLELIALHELKKCLFEASKEFKPENDKREFCYAGAPVKREIETALKILNALEENHENLKNK